MDCKFLKHAERNFTIKMNKSNAEKINVVKLKSFMTNKVLIQFIEQ